MLLGQKDIQIYALERLVAQLKTRVAELDPKPEKPE